MILAAWLLTLPFRLLAALGLRRSVILACLLVLAITVYGVAQDLGLIQPPAQAAPAPKPSAGQPAPSRAAIADTPRRYLRLYRQAGARYRIPWPVLAAIGKVESNHGPALLPWGGVRAATGPGLRADADRLCARNSKAGNAWARYGRGRPHDPAEAIPAAARYLVDHGARRDLDRAIYAYNHSRSYVVRVKQLARRYARGGGRWRAAGSRSTWTRAWAGRRRCSWLAVGTAAPSWPAAPARRWPPEPHGGSAAGRVAPGLPGGCPGPPAWPPTSRWPGAGATPLQPPPLAA